MKRTLFIFAFLLLFFQFTQAQQLPKREMRGAWIASYFGIDWPNKNQTPAQQRAAFISIVNHHQATGINTLFIQVRSQCDALYPSAIEPWSSDLTGTQGVGPNPAWDPMQFMIAECHKRGIEFHAWMNPYRAVGNANNLPNFADNHVAKQHPEWLLSQGTLRVLDPGLPAVRDYITSVVTDVVQRYDVDGIHFDDYFYPSGTAYNDDSSYAADPRGFTNRGDWRRDNINLLIERLYDSIKNIKSWVKFGVSPSGIYRNSSNPDIGSATSGLQHYVTLFADTRKWLQQGWVDYICPQVYWYIGQPGANYAVLIPWWNNQAAGRHIYIGMAGYKINDLAQGANWANPSQIPNQVRMNRDTAYPNIYGQSIYNTSSLRSSTKLGFRDSLRLFFYRKPALLPSMPWRDSMAPAAPVLLSAVKYAGDSVVLNWIKPAPAPGELDKAKRFVVYRSETPAIDINDAENIMTITPSDTSAFTDKTILPNTTYYYTVTSLDRLHNESSVSNTAANLPPVIVCPDNKLLVLDTACTVILPDYRDSVMVNGMISPPGITITQWPVAGDIITGGGEMPVTLIATDAGGNADTCSFTVTTKDNSSPLITGASASPAQLWPPNHRLRDVAINYNAADNCGPVTNMLSVTSNEQVTGNGYPNTQPDWVIVDEHHVKLRAERDRGNSDRVYTITITSTDTAGNVSTQPVTVTVPCRPDNPIPDGLSTVKVFPNPTPHQFIVLTLSTSPQSLKVTVTDNAGKIIETRNSVPANGLFQLGARYRPGVYYLEVTQGNKKETVRLVKL